jgi:hypothetical protein
MEKPSKDKLLAEITNCLFCSAERYGLSEEIVGDTVADIQHIFGKDSKKKDKKCLICGN